MTSQSTALTVPPTAGKIVLAGALFGVLFAPTFWFMMSWLPASIGINIAAIAFTAILSGGLFALLLALFMGSKRVAQQTAIELPEGETLEQQGWANHFRNFEGRGGRLYLTNRSLVFQPHHFNVQNAGVVIPRSEIAGAAKSMTLGVIPNGLTVTRRDCTAERFVVSERDEWVRRLTPERGASSG
jgi:GRAM domain